jgi:hypothetical protein
MVYLLTSNISVKSKHLTSPNKYYPSQNQIGKVTGRFSGNGLTVLKPNRLGNKYKHNTAVSAIATTQKTVKLNPDASATYCGGNNPKSGGQCVSGYANQLATSGNNNANNIGHSNFRFTLTPTIYFNELN